MKVQNLIKTSLLTAFVAVLSAVTTLGAETPNTFAQAEFEKGVALVDLIRPWALGLFGLFLGVSLLVLFIRKLVKRGG